MVVYSARQLSLSSCGLTRCRPFHLPLSEYAWTLAMLLWDVGLRDVPPVHGQLHQRQQVTVR